MSRTGLSADVAAVVERLAAAYDLFQVEAEVGERLRRPSPAVRDALQDSGVFGLIMPRELGGLEATPTEVLTVIERLSYADASLGWLARSIVTETALAATYLPQEAIEELRTDGFPLVSGHATSYTGTAEAAEGGYRVTGTWHFAPGTSVATHLNLSVTCDDGEPLVCLVPRNDVWLADNWDMLGLRATASLDYSVKDLYVPARMTFRIQHGKALRGGESSRLSPALLAGL
ncbi:acyl-CoA dehydrogenase family protein, partial [Flexivirga sp.]|uniref:acyl-CoA dehydrogenase family protein n=1 Tax=Flexivirga sp. TaxID=1962927 RepID=UPI003F7E17F1